MTICTMNYKWLACQREDSIQLNQFETILERLAIAKGTLFPPGYNAEARFEAWKKALVKGESAPVQ